MDELLKQLKRLRHFVSESAESFEEDEDLRRLRQGADAEEGGTVNLFESPDMPEALLLPIPLAAHVACQGCPKCGIDIPCNLGSADYPAIPEGKRRKFARDVFYFFGNVGFDRPATAAPPNPDMRFYELPLEAEDARALANQYGYELKFFGGEYGPPNFRDYNYQSGWLNVYAPNGGNSYREKWGIIHELSHALAGKELGEGWGAGQEVGRPNGGLSLRGAMLAVDWENRAIAKQHEILNKHFGVEIERTAANKEANAVLADTVIRIFTGRHSEPFAAEFGDFLPSPLKVFPLQALEFVLSLGVVLNLGREVGRNPYGVSVKTLRDAVLLEQGQTPKQPKRAPVTAPSVQDWDKEIGFGYGRGYSWNGPHFAGLA